jgi:hypothetical protein
MAADAYGSNAEIEQGVKNMSLTTPANAQYDEQVG